VYDKYFLRITDAKAKILKTVCLLLKCALYYFILIYSCVESQAKNAEFTKEEYACKGGISVLKVDCRKLFPGQRTKVSIKSLCTGRSIILNESTQLERVYSS